MQSGGGDSRFLKIFEGNKKQRSTAVEFLFAGKTSKVE